MNADQARTAAYEDARNNQWNPPRGHGEPIRRTYATAWEFHRRQLGRPC